MHKATCEVWDAQRLAILVVNSLFCMHKSTGEVRDPCRLVILLIKTLF